MTYFQEACPSVPFNDRSFCSEWYDYLPEICEPLTREFGTRFELQNTGGWCMALEAKLENGDLILVTDAYDTLSSMTVRRKRWRNDREILGYSVGLYPHEEPSDFLAYVVFPKARDAEAVAIAIKSCIRLGQRVRAGQVDAPAELVI